MLINAQSESSNDVKDGVMAIQTFGEYPDRFHPHLHALVSDGLFTKTDSVEKMTYAKETGHVIYQSKMTHGKNKKKIYEVDPLQIFLDKYYHASISYPPRSSGT